VKTLGSPTPRRVAILPHVATLAENAVPGFDLQAWLGIAAPAGAPPDVVARLSQASARSPRCRRFRGGWRRWARPRFPHSDEYRERSPATPEIRRHHPRRRHRAELIRIEAEAAQAEPTGQKPRNERLRFCRSAVENSRRSTADALSWTHRSDAACDLNPRGGA